MTLTVGIGHDKCYYMILDGVATHRYSDRNQLIAHEDAIARNEDVIRLPDLETINPADYGWTEKKA